MLPLKPFFAAHLGNSSWSGTITATVQTCESIKQKILNIVIMLMQQLLYIMFILRIENNAIGYVSLALLWFLMLIGE